MAFDLPVEHHPRLYLAGGDVVLAAKTSPSIDLPPTAGQAPEPPKYWLFRIDKFTLSRHSTAFNDLFTVASAAAGDTYDGVPLVPMPGDRAQDLALLLLYVYYPTYAHNHWLLRIRTGIHC